MTLEWNNIKGCGTYTTINRLGNEKKLNRLLTETLVEFARRNVRYHKAINEWIFVYNERQNVSALLPALLSSCNEAFVECPVKRRLDGVESTRAARIDYWALYDNHTVLLIETKQAFISAKTSKHNNYYHQDWDNLKEQLRSIKKKEIWDGLTTPKTTLVYKIGIQMGVIYSHRKNKDYCEVYRTEIEDLASIIASDRKIDADWIGVWQTPDKVKFNERRNQYQQYPACFWAVKAERIDWR